MNTQDESVLIRWETCGPEVARIVSEFGDSLYKQDASSSAAKHREDNENSDRNSTGMLNLFIKQFHVIPLKWLL